MPADHGVGNHASFGGHYEDVVQEIQVEMLDGRPDLCGAPFLLKRTQVRAD
jgi:hypothetical protein